MALSICAQAEPIPGYTLVEPLGQGGFGEVWRAVAPGGIPKAIKFLKGNLNDVDGKVPAAQELKSLNRVKDVHHPFILGIERVDIVDGQLMIVMELADRNLLDRHEECQAQGMPGIPRAELLRYMHETAEALDLMNGEYQLQHLDIKPQNLFLVRNHVKVADFGLVKDLEGMQAVVTSGVTPVYASPETFEGKVSCFSDQYSLAIVYQEMLTGQRPINGKNARQLMMAHVKAPPDLTSLPPGDRELVGKALAKNPNERYPTCGEFIRALKKAAGGAPPARPSEPNRSTTPKDATPDPAPRTSRPTAPGIDLSAAASHKSKLRPEPPSDERPPAPHETDDDAPESAPKKGGSGDTVEMAGASKSPTLRIKPATKEPKEEVPCPRCEAALINPGQYAWCASCGYCADQDEDARRSRSSLRGVLPWLLVLVGGIGGMVLMRFADRLVPAQWNLPEMWNIATLLIGGGATLIVSMALYLAWPKKRKRKKANKMRSRRAKSQE